MAEYHQSLLVLSELTVPRRSKLLKVPDYQWSTLPITFAPYRHSPRVPTASLAIVSTYPSGPVVSFVFVEDVCPVPWVLHSRASCISFPVLFSLFSRGYVLSMFSKQGISAKIVWSILRASHANSSTDYSSRIQRKLFAAGKETLLEKYLTPKFRVKNSSVIFQCALNTVFNIMPIDSLVYLVYVIVFSWTLGKHTEYLDGVFTSKTQPEFVEATESFHCETKGNFLGQISFNKEIDCDPVKHRCHPRIQTRKMFDAGLTGFWSLLELRNDVASFPKNWAANNFSEDPLRLRHRKFWSKMQVGGAWLWIATEWVRLKIFIRSREPSSKERHW